MQGAAEPVSAKALRKNIQAITRGYDPANPHLFLNPHDLRRTAAALMFSVSGEYDPAKNLLRHKSVATTERYIGLQIDYSAACFTTYGIEL